MPYLQIDLPGSYPSEKKKRIARKLGDIYCEIMKASAGIVNISFRELGSENMYRTGRTEPIPVCIINCDIRQGRTTEQRRALGEAMVNACKAEFGSPKGGYTVSFTQHPGDEWVRDGKLDKDWCENEGTKGNI